MASVLEGVRKKFVARFGEAEAQAIETAARQHATEGFLWPEPENHGTDEFKWALMVCISFDCLVKPEFREHHGFQAPLEEVKDWIVAEAELRSYDGSFSYISAFCGTYNEFLGLPERPDEGTPGA